MKKYSYRSVIVCVLGLMGFARSLAMNKMSASKVLGALKEVEARLNRAEKNAQDALVQSQSTNACAQPEARPQVSTEDLWTLAKKAIIGNDKNLFHFAAGSLGHLGADLINACFDGTNTTLLMYARQRKLVDMEKFLISCGAVDFEVKDDKVDVVIEQESSNSCARVNKKKRRADARKGKAKSPVMAVSSQEHDDGKVREEGRGGQEGECVVGTKDEPLVVGVMRVPQRVMKRIVADTGSGSVTDKVMQYVTGNKGVTLAPENRCDMLFTTLVDMRHVQGNKRTEFNKNFLKEVAYLPDIDVRSEHAHNATLLMAAAECGFADIVKGLLELKADPLLQCARGLNSFMYAIMGKKSSRNTITGLLVDGVVKNKPDEITSLIMAATCNGHRVLLDVMCQKNISLQVRDVNGCDPLLAAIAGNRLDMVKWLWQHEYEAVVVGMERNICLLSAALDSHRQDTSCRPLIEFLCEHGISASEQAEEKMPAWVQELLSKARRKRQHACEQEELRVRAREEGERELQRYRAWRADRIAAYQAQQRSDEVRDELARVLCLADAQEAMQDPLVAQYLEQAACAERGESERVRRDRLISIFDLVRRDYANDQKRGDDILGSLGDVISCWANARDYLLKAAEQGDIRYQDHLTELLRTNQVFLLQAALMEQYNNDVFKIVSACD